MNAQRVLVTGGTGFLASHCLLQLLQQGYLVTTTVRSMDRERSILDALEEGGWRGGEPDSLRVVQADLLNDRNWDRAVADCQYVLHVASPIFLRPPKSDEEFVRPAVEGVLRVLRASRDAGVRRVVLTSNFGAVGYSHRDPSTLIDERSWTDPEEPGLSAYNKSKVLAERAAWDFLSREGGQLELSVVNPVGIFGPALAAPLSSGFELLLAMILGRLPGLPDIRLAIVDVRDVADLHLRAMNSPQAGGQRYLALAGGTLSLVEISELLKKERPELTRKMTVRRFPTWLLRVLSLGIPFFRGLGSLVGINRNASNEKAKRELGWSPRSQKEALLATVDNLKRWGHLPSESKGGIQ